MTPEEKILTMFFMLLLAAFCIVMLTSTTAQSDYYRIQCDRQIVIEDNQTNVTWVVEVGKAVGCVGCHKETPIKSITTISKIVELDFCELCAGYAGDLWVRAAAVFAGLRGSYKYTNTLFECR